MPCPNGAYVNGNCQCQACWANDKIQELRAALIEIEKHYGNQDMSHRDYRVMVKRLADEALEK